MWTALLEGVGPDGVPTIWLIVLGLGGLVSVGGAALLAGWRIVEALEKRLEKYVLKEVAESERKSLMEMVTHIHGCMHKMEAKIDALTERNRRKDRDDDYQ